MKILELFSGYGTASFALKRLGINYELVGYSDIDKYANQCFKQNHCPDDIDDKLRLWDVKQINPENLEDFDLLTGGFPCQSFSVAGKGLGEADPRGTLFYEIIRIAEVKQPKYMLLENVKGLTNKTHKQTFDKILSELERIGYYVHWKVLNSKDYGIPQSRARVWFVCFREQSDYDKFTWPEKEELKLFIKDILEPEPVDDKFYLKEHQVQKLLEGIAKKMNFKNRILQNKDICQTLMSRDYKEPKCVNIKTIDTQGNPIPNIPEIGEANRIYDIEGVSPSIKASAINIKSLTSVAKDNLIVINPYNGKNSTTETGTIGTSIGTTTGKTSQILCVNTQPRRADRPSLKDNKNAGGSGTIWKDDGTTYCLDTANAQAIISMGSCESVLKSTGIFRRLTPKECFRLMGFLNDEINLEGLSDTRKYILAGNGQDVNMVSLIFKQMFKGE